MLVSAKQVQEDSVRGRDLVGVCAICKKRTIVRYCPKCSAVFCEGCRNDYFQRGIEAVKALLFDRGSHGFVEQQGA